MKYLILFLISIFPCFLGDVVAQEDTTGYPVIREHFIQITKTEKPRNHLNVDVLNDVADYIKNEFEKHCDSVYFQIFEVNGRTYRNVIGVFNSDNPETVVIGAHYDVCEDQEGADDNASGVIGLLELSRLIAENDRPKNRIELVAYTLEEPPYFKTTNMGSYVHAASLKDKNVDVRGMICLEMIGYFDESKGSQGYPLGMMKLFYGSRGDYIGLINKVGKGSFARKFNRKFKRNAAIRTKKVTAPKKVPGIDFSDHQSYWKMGYSAVMITDTAFYRNRNYHEKTDTMETLNFGKMAKVIDGVYHALSIMPE